MIMYYGSFITMRSQVCLSLLEQSDKGRGSQQP